MTKLKEEVMQDVENVVNKVMTATVKELEPDIKQMFQTLCLFNSMISAGEKHSETSIGDFARARRFMAEFEEK